MEEIIEIIENKIELHRIERQRLLHESSIAKRLGFDRQFEVIEQDRKYLMNTMDELSEIKSKILKVG